MDSNYETIKSLISLLVRKSGFDVDKNVASLELEKTENLIKSYEEDLVFVKDPEERQMMEKTLEQLKCKKEAWQNNSEIVGKHILNEYINNKEIDSIKKELEILKSNATSTRLSNESLMSSVYRELFVCNKKIKQLEEKIQNNDYYKTGEKQVDEALIEYLKNKIDDYESELDKIDVELNKFKDLEIKDVEALNKIKEYESKETTDMEKVEKLLEISDDKNSSIELWERVNNIKSKLTQKQEIIKNYVNKLEENLKFIRNNHLEYSNRKKKMTEELGKFKNLLIGATEKYSRNDYFDYASKMIDENELELAKEKLEQFNNKKEVIYIDVDEIVEEIEKEWNKKKSIASSSSMFSSYKPIFNFTEHKVETVQNEKLKENTELKENIELEENTQLEKTLEQEQTPEENIELQEHSSQEIEENNDEVIETAEEIQEEIIPEENVPEENKQEENLEVQENNVSEEKINKEEIVTEPKSNRIELDW